MNKVQVKKMSVDLYMLRVSLDLFEAGKYSDAKDILKKEIHEAKVKWLQNKLGMKEKVEC